MFSQTLVRVEGRLDLQFSLILVNVSAVVQIDMKHLSFNLGQLIISLGWAAAIQEITLRYHDSVDNFRHFVVS